MNGRDSASHWAVLIGINFYAKDLPKDVVQDGEKPIEGCVRDVESIKEYLETKPTRANLAIKTFTASAPSDPTSNLPAEEEDSWPTYENVTSSLEKITEEAKPGDLVYIHYSGHGTQTPGTSSEYSNKNTGDLALVLFDPVHKVRYLRGQKLASMLNKMVEKALLVTLVLDCCFSGSVLRNSDPNGAGIRALDYDPAVDAAYPQNLDAFLDQQVSSSNLRDAHMLPNWLVEPNGYSILAACGPHERAYELKFSDGKKNGALSYFLFQALTALRKSGVEITHQSLYQHLCVKFHASWPRQNPMRYGNKNFSLFGKLRFADMSFIPVMKQNSCLCLEAGQIHGVSKDDEYALYPFHASEDISDYIKQASVRVRVDAVRGLTSDLVGIDSNSDTSQVKTGWKARLLTRLAPRTVLVRLGPEVENRPQWIAAAKRRRFLDLATVDAGEQPCLFNVERNERNEYEILDASRKKIAVLPTAALGKNGTLDTVLGLLEHLATFKYVERIENRIPTASFEESFEIRLNDEGGRDQGAAGRLDVNHEDKLNLIVQNIGTRPLYIAILDMDPSWQITILTCKSGAGGFLVVPPQDDKKGHSGRAEIKWKMIVPESLRNQGQYYCEDVIKIFVTSRPTSFAPLVLPRISTSAENADGPVRGDRNQLSQFLSELATPHRGTDDDEEWVTRNFVICTHCDKDTV